MRVWTAWTRIIERERWAMIIGSDINDSRWGITFVCHPDPNPRPECYRWLTRLRISFSWPVSFRFRSYR